MHDETRDAAPSPDQRERNDFGGRISGELGPVNLMQDKIFGGAHLDPSWPAIQGSGGLCRLGESVREIDGLIIPRAEWRLRRLLARSIQSPTAIFAVARVGHR